jgi:hypothetical protein
MLFSVLLFTYGAIVYVVYNKWDDERANMWEEGHEDEYKVVSSEEDLTKNEGKTVFLLGKPRILNPVNDESLQIKWPAYHNIVVLHRKVECFHWGGAKKDMYM